MIELDMYQTIKADEVVPREDMDLNDFVSGMSEIAIGKKDKPPKVDALCVTVEEGDSDLEDINIVDI